VLEVRRGSRDRRAHKDDAYRVRHDEAVREVVANYEAAGGIVGRRAEAVGAQGNPRAAVDALVYSK